MLSTSPTAPRLSYLHGLGRRAHRAGTTAAGSIANAQLWATVDGPADRLAVMAGWRMESDAAMEGGL